MLTQAAATTRISSRSLPLNGTAQLLQVIEGTGWAHSWHCSCVDRFGHSLEGQVKSLFIEPGGAHTASWMNAHTRFTKVSAGDLVWIPFGHYTAVTATVAGPLVMLTMPYVNDKLVQLERSCEAVLGDLTRQLSRQQDKGSDDCPWNNVTGLHAFKQWCTDLLDGLGRPRQALPQLEDGQPASSTDMPPDTVPGTVGAQASQSLSPQLAAAVAPTAATAASLSEQELEDAMDSDGGFTPKKAVEDKSETDEKKTEDDGQLA